MKYTNCFSCEKVSETKYCHDCRKAIDTLCQLNKKFIAYHGDGFFQFVEETNDTERGTIIALEIEGEVVEKLVDLTTLMSCDISLLRRYDLEIYRALTTEETGENDL